MMAKKPNQEQALELINDLITGNFTIANEQTKTDRLISLLGINASPDDVIEQLIISGEIQTAEQGLEALQKFPKAE